MMTDCQVSDPRLKSLNYYWPQRSCGQGNIFTPVCHSFCSQRGGGLPQCMLGYHPPGADTPLGSDTPVPDTTPQGADIPPQEQTPPGADTPPDTTPRSRPPRGRHPPGPDTLPDQTPPPGSRLQHTVYERPVRTLLECILVCKYTILLNSSN